MPISAVSLCNRALDMIGADPITSLADAIKPARLCERNYEAVRDAVLRAYPWNSAMRRAALPALSEAPAWGFARQFELPNDCLRLYHIDGEIDIGSRYRIEGRRVLTDETAPLKILYIARIEDPTIFDPLLGDAIAARLAADLAFALTGSAALGQSLIHAYRDKLSEARRTDAQEGSADGLTASDWLESRL